MEKEIIDILKRDNAHLRFMGCQLAIAAIRVISDYDGIHRLALAVSRWMDTIANEGNRADNQQKGND